MLAGSTRKVMMSELDLGARPFEVLAGEVARVSGLSRSDMAVLKGWSLDASALRDGALRAFSHGSSTVSEGDGGGVVSYAHFSLNGSGLYASFHTERNGVAVGVPSTWSLRIKPDGSVVAVREY